MAERLVSLPYTDCDFNDSLKAMWKYRSIVNNSVISAKGLFVYTYTKGVLVDPKRHSGLSPVIFHTNKKETVRWHATFIVDHTSFLGGPLTGASTGECTTS